MLIQFDYVTKFSISLIMLFFCIIHHVIIICGVCVGRHLANLYVTHSEMMHLALSCEVHHFKIVQRILDSLRMMTSVYYLVSLALVYLSFVVLAV
jgi:hypothetical protein